MDLKLTGRLAVALAALAGAAPALAQGAAGENITHVKNLEFSNTFALSQKNAGTDLEFAELNGRTYSFAGSYGDGLQVFDITDPRNTVRVASKDCGVSQGDVQVFARGDRTYVAYSHDDGYTFGGNTACSVEATKLGFSPKTVTEGSDPIFSGGAGSGTFIFDVTDLGAIKTVGYIQIPQGSHNITMHPGGEYLYNSNSDLMTSALPAIEVFKLNFDEAPTKVSSEKVFELPLKTVPGLGTESHDITFNDEGTRAYSAALSHNEIIDTTNPAQPVIIGTLVDPAINLWHQSDPITITHPVLGKRDFLVVEDEFVGALGTGQCPNGGVHVYDITGPLEMAPVKVGYWNISDVGTTKNGITGGCTAHVFDLHEDSALMTIAYYNGGIRVVDLSNLVGAALGKLPAGVPGMTQLGYHRFDNSDTWAVKAPRGTAKREGFFLYGNDQARGFDVYEYKPGATSSPGQWFTPAQALKRMNKLRGKGIQMGGICLLGDRLK